MVPACIRSSEENNFAAGLIPDDDWAFIGLYKNDTHGGWAEGGGRCVAGDASGFANWHDDRPTPAYDGLIADCAIVTGQGRWTSTPCVEPAAIGRSFRCLCDGPSSPAVAFAQDLPVLEAAVEAAMRVIKARALRMYLVCSALAVLPMLLLLGHRWLRHGRGAFDALGELSAWAQASLTLRAAHRGAAQRRLLVSGLMALSGWALLVFGLAPTILSLMGHSVDAFVGPSSYWLIMCGTGAWSP